MGEYFDWINVDKKQYIDPSEFGHGSKRYESCFYHAEVLGVLYSLLADEWKGDHIIFAGDEADVPQNPWNESLRILRDQCLGDKRGLYGYMLEEYTCLSGLFKAAEEEVREEIEIIRNDPEECFNWYHVDLNHPYKGLFERDLYFPRYVINRSRREYYDTEKTTWKDGEYRMDPLPLLLCYGYNATQNNSGLWLGDTIHVTDNMPGNGYTDISYSYIWDP